jgi:glutaminyl-tRNA synthetase
MAPSNPPSNPPSNSPVNSTSSAQDPKGAAGSEEVVGAPTHFIKEIIEADNTSGKHDGRVATRFPPEPNGYLHIGHAKSICLNFGLAQEYGGTCNLRFDDTNPSKEEVEYVNAIMADVRWLGHDWNDRLYYSSDYFDGLYDLAVGLIEKGKAYVCDLSAEEGRGGRGAFGKPGTNSPYRERSVEENLDLFGRMRAGEFDEGSRVLRAKIDMAAPNMNLRDPTLYRILKATHHRTGDKWCIYPTYDFAHGQSDALEAITHSLCTLEFENHRPLYDWFLDNLELAHRPRQIEFAKLNLSYTVLSKRRLLEMVADGSVEGWDDPRMPTLVGLRRRGIPAAAIRNFCDRVGVAKREGVVDITLLEHAVREELNDTSPRVMGVLRPLKVVIENYPEDQVEEFDCPYHPVKPEMGTRKVPFSRVLYIERGDFMENAPKKFYRLDLGREVRLRYAYLVTCTEVIKDEAGEVIELRCTYDPETRGGNAPDGRKVKSTMHWVSLPHALSAEVRLYDRLFGAQNPLEGGDWKASFNPDSLEVLTDCAVEPSLGSAASGHQVQFERQGYFCVDTEDSTPDKLVFNRTVSLRDAWAKIQKAQQQNQPSKKKNKNKQKKQQNKLPNKQEGK